LYISQCYLVLYRNISEVTTELNHEINIMAKYSTTDRELE